MKEQPEALWLAVRGAFRGGLTLGEVQEAEDELNRLTRERDALLEACQTLVNLPEDWIATLRLLRVAVEQARAAIAKAEGEKT